MSTATTFQSDNAALKNLSRGLKLLLIYRLHPVLLSLRIVNYESLNMHMVIN